MGMIKGVSLCALIAMTGLAAADPPGATQPEVRIEYRIPKWIPYATAATGLALGLGGYMLWRSGEAKMDEFESRFAATCTMGCDPNFNDHPELGALRDSAETRGELGYAGLFIGGAAAITGLVLVIWNQPHLVPARVEIAPTSGGATARLGWSF